MSQLDNRTAVIVGAGGHFGRAVVRRFVREGATVVALDSDAGALGDSLEEVSAHRQQIIDRVIDYSSAESFSRIIAELEGDAIDVDILVNMVWGHLFGLVDEMGEEAWDSDIDRNLSITYRATQAIAKVFKRRRAGRIVNVSSTSKDGVPWFAGTGHSAHAAARGGVVGFTRALAYELGEFGIAVNCVVAGPIRTPGAERAFSKARQGPTSRAVPEQMIALRRFGTPDELANAVLFLASEEASFITGESLYVSGGLYG